MLPHPHVHDARACPPQPHALLVLVEPLPKRAPQQPFPEPHQRLGHRQPDRPLSPRGFQPTGQVGPRDSPQELSSQRHRRPALHRSVLEAAVLVLASGLLDPRVDRELECGQASPRNEQRDLPRLGCVLVGESAPGCKARPEDGEV
eukprot:3811095-Rhodomonas_salina.1